LNWELRRILEDGKILHGGSRPARSAWRETWTYLPTWNLLWDGNKSRSLNFRLMSVRSPNSLASNRDPISASDTEALTPSPLPRESSHEEYSPDRPSNAISVTTEFTSPSSRSNTTGNLPADVRAALNTLYSDIYGEDSWRCLVTHSKLSLILAHVVQRASAYDQVRVLSVVRSRLIFF